MAANYRLTFPFCACAGSAISSLNLSAKCVVVFSQGAPADCCGASWIDGSSVNRINRVVEDGDDGFAESVAVVRALEILPACLMRPNPVALHGANFVRPAVESVEVA